MGVLTGRIGIVVGASSGIGLATAKLFAKEGARLVVTARDGRYRSRDAGLRRRGLIAFEPGVGVTDPANIRRTFQEWFALNPRFDYKGHEVLVAGDLALHVAPWRMRGTAPDGTPIEQQGLSVAVLRRQADGRWLLVIDNPYGQHLLNDRG